MKKDLYMHTTLRFTLLFLLLFSTLDAAYLLKESKRAKSVIDHMPKNKVADMKNIPQNPAYYASSN